MADERYIPSHIEQRWRQRWEEMGLFRCDDQSKLPKFYCLVMFPYPSGALHVGHGRNYVIGDVVARYKAMRRYNVLHPIGWDAFGLPAENAAIKRGMHPKTYVAENVPVMKAQMQALGIGYDWDREINTSAPEYYRWTQWVFLQLHKRGLAYRADAPVNWCPSCQTGLANEEVVNDRCERCDTQVVEKDLPQWFFKITDYADALLDDLDLLDAWPEHVRRMQANWIGRSEGALVNFKVAHTGQDMPCFTTRPDTLWGVTFMSLAPEHPAIPALVAGTAAAGNLADGRPPAGPALVVSILLVALACSLGASLCEMSGYYAGALGKKIAIPDELSGYKLMQRWIQKYGVWAIALLSFQPLLPIEVGGFIAGAARMPVRKFLPALWLGKYPKYIILMYGGLGLIRLLPFLRQ
jgi:leucyl-tRNA synthetase/membrane protein YqaA with SNARE-associated domain